MSTRASKDPRASKDALSSPTLALLYLAQGHPARAQATLDEVLADDPHNGMALALRERLELGPVPVVHAALEPGEGVGDALVLSWSMPDLHPQLGSRLELVLAFARADGAAALRYTSRTCAGPRGRERIPAPLWPGSLALALVAHVRSGKSTPASEKLRFLAVAPPLTW